MKAESSQTFTICRQPGRMIGWPTVAKAPDGSLFTLTDGWTDSYMVGRWPERIEALIEAIDVSFPGYFSKAQTYLKDFAKNRLSRIFLKAKNTASPTE